jgi:hypothetical protein
MERGRGRRRLGWRGEERRGWMMDERRVWRRGLLERREGHWSGWRRGGGEDGEEKDEERMR